VPALEVILSGTGVLNVGIPVSPEVAHHPFAVPFF